MRVSDLEEFGLEVERENHALITPTRTTTRAGLPVLPLTTPSKEQRNLLISSSNSRTSTFTGSGILKWTILLLALTLAVFLHLQQESDTTQYVEETLLAEVEECIDDPEFSIMLKSTKNCASYVANVGRKPLLESRCSSPIGIPDEDGFQKLLKHFCRKSCGLCGTEDEVVEEGESEKEIEEEVHVIAEEIEEKELEEEIEKELEEEIELEKELEEQEKEMNDVANVEEEDAEDGDGVDGNGNVQQQLDEDTDNEGEDNANNGKEDGGSHSSDIAEGDDDGEEDNAPAAMEGEGGESTTIIEQGDENSTESDIGDVPMDVQEPNDTGGESDAPEEDANGRANDYDVAEVKNDTVVAVVEDMEEKETPTVEASGEGTTSNQQAVVDFGGKFTLQHVQATREAATNLIIELEQYYSGTDQAKRMMLNAWQSPWKFDNPKDESTERERVDKIVDTIARALVTDDQSEFVIGTIGSSVAAGHDNCHYDSYESQLERTFGPVWEAAGMKFVNQNSGIGGGCGDDYKNQVFCIKQNVSPNIDIVHYTWTYFEHGSDKYVSRENLIRWTQMLPHQPPVHVFNTQLISNERQEDELAEHYAKYGYNQFYIKTGHLNGGYDYATDTKNEIDHYAWGYVGDGYHMTTRYGAKETNLDRQESLGVVFRNWHPGPLAFEFLSDTFAYVYSKAMLMALDLIESDMIEGKDPRDTWSSAKRKILMKKSLPEPKFCDPNYCVVDEAPSCLNYERPVYGYWGAKVEDPDDQLNPHRGELQKWEVWQEEVDFWNGVGKQDTVIFQEREDKEICKHLDGCGGISATSSENGKVVFRLPKMEVGLVAICMCCGKEVAQEQILQNPYIEIRYNTQLLDKSKWDIFPTGKCVRLLEKFPTEGRMAETPTGHAYLSISLNNTLNESNKPIRISHVITL